MSQQYDEYLHEHISNVNKAVNWLIDHNVVPAFVEFECDTNNSEFPLKVSILDSIERHDSSKFDDAEYSAYDDYFYGKEGMDEDDIEVIDSAFDYAWLHHIHNNPHHWQYWVLINDDDGKPKPLEMPKLFVVEMIADWMSFAFKKGDLYEVVNWYAEHKDKMILHKKTRALVEDIIVKINDITVHDKEEEDAQTPS